MINNILQDLQETWDYSTEELNDIKEKMEQLAYSSFMSGYDKRSEEVERYYKGFSYAKKSDMDDYE